MRLENAVAADVLERILSAYGFTMQKELSDKLGIAKSNVASWLQRGQVPGNVLVQCALDTGADVKWLVEGGFANANISMLLTSETERTHRGKSLIRKMLSSGGKSVLKRIMDAYGFSTQKELSDYLGISTGTISTWVRRGYFPGDVVIACSLDTGISLKWLAVGYDSKIQIDEINNVRDKTQALEVTRFSLLCGALKKVGECCLDHYFLPESSSLKNIFIITMPVKTLLIDASKKELNNGDWLLSVEGLLDVYTVHRMPKNKIRLSKGLTSFDCDVDDVVPQGSVVAEFSFL